MKPRHSTLPSPATPSVAFAHTVALAAVLFAGVVGCGGSSAEGRHPDGGGPPGTGAFTWKDGGTLHTALFASGTRVTVTGTDMVSVTGSDSGAAVSFNLSIMPPPLVAGAWACSDNGTGTTRIVTIAYTVGTDSALAPDCAITLTSFGATTGTHATGTFSATVPLGNGTTRTITDGVYDVLLTVSSI